jgi:acyl carrier protein
MPDIEDAVLEIIAAKAKQERSALSRQTELATLNLDSLDVVEIIFQIEEKFDISIPYNANDPATSGASLKVAGDVVDLVQQHVGTQAAQ